MGQDSDTVVQIRPMISTNEIVLRLLAALVFSGAVGLQRELTGKTAGMRTHILVGVGAASYTLVSGYAFETTAASVDRIAAQVVSGIGFIGGGAILKERGSIKGLTTAAGLWAAAALGMAAGAGLYTISIVASLVVLLTLVVLRRVEKRMPGGRLETWALQVSLDSENTVEEVRKAVAPVCGKILLIGLESGGEVRATFSVKVPRHYDIAPLTQQLRTVGARSVAWRAGGNAEGDDVG